MNKSKIKKQINGKWSFKKERFLIIVLIFPFLLPALTKAANEGSQLCEKIMPCEGLECQPCHLLVMLENIIECLLMRIVPAVAVLMLVVAGAMFIIAYFGEEETLPGGGKGGPALWG